MIVCVYYTRNTVHFLADFSVHSSNALQINYLESLLQSTEIRA